MTKMSDGRTTLEYKKECVWKEIVLREPHGNNRYRVLNNMTEICIVNSKHIVMSNEKGNLEEQGRIGDKHMVTKWGKWE